MIDQSCNSAILSVSLSFCLSLCRSVCLPGGLFIFEASCLSVSLTGKSSHRYSRHVIPQSDSNRQPLESGADRQFLIKCLIIKWYRSTYFGTGFCFMLHIFLAKKSIESRNFVQITHASISLNMQSHYDVYSTDRRQL